MALPNGPQWWRIILRSRARQTLSRDHLRTFLMRKNDHDVLINFKFIITRVSRSSSLPRTCWTANSKRCLGWRRNMTLSRRCGIVSISLCGTLRRRTPHSLKSKRDYLGLVDMSYQRTRDQGSNRSPPRAWLRIAIERGYGFSRNLRCERLAIHTVGAHIITRQFPNVQIQNNV